MLISFIIPCYRSENTIEKVVDGIREQFITRHGYSYQIILVCDASPDGVFEKIKLLCKHDSNIMGLNFSRNYGQQSAIMAGIAQAQGDYLVFIDDDGQHPPEGIFNLLEKIQNDDYDVVFAEFENKKHTAMQRFGSHVNRFMASLLIGMPKGIKPSSFFAMRAFVGKECINYQNPHPYVGGYIFQITKRIGTVNLEHRKRIEGKSNYNFIKLVGIWMRGFTSFSVVPLRIASFVGAIVAIIGFLFSIVIVVNRLINPEIAMGYTSLMAAILVVGGIIMMMLGMLGEYVGRIYMSINKLPQYVIRETVGDKESEDKQ